MGTWSSHDEDVTRLKDAPWFWEQLEQETSRLNQSNSAGCLGSLIILVPVFVVQMILSSLIVVWEVPKYALNSLFGRK